jgi:group I intron endonuclease
MSNDSEKLCNQCNQTISIKRLEILPETKICADCIRKNKYVASNLFASRIEPIDQQPYIDAVIPRARQFDSARHYVPDHPNLRGKLWAEIWNRKATAQPSSSIDTSQSMVVYKTTNTINNKIYVGKDSKNNPTYLGSGKLLKEAITEYGKENFVKEVLEICNSTELLDEREKYWIKELDALNPRIGYNIYRNKNQKSQSDYNISAEMIAESNWARRVLELNHRALDKKQTTNDISTKQVRRRIKEDQEQKEYNTLSTDGTTVYPIQPRNKKLRRINPNTL